MQPKWKILLSKLLDVWDKLSGYKLIIGLILNTIADHFLVDNSLESDIVYILALFFITAGGIHRGVKSKYGNKTLERFKIFRKSN